MSFAGANGKRRPGHVDPDDDDPDAYNTDLVMHPSIMLGASGADLDLIERMEDERNLMPTPEGLSLLRRAFLR